MTSKTLSAIVRTFQTVAQGFFHGQSAFFSLKRGARTLLDTLDHFD
jgi:hypothetical protein